jgi:hypothetical protein
MSTPKELMSKYQGRLHGRLATLRWINCSNLDQQGWVWVTKAKLELLKPPRRLPKHSHSAASWRAMHSPRWALPRRKVLANHWRLTTMPTYSAAWASLSSKNSLKILILAQKTSWKVLNLKKWIKSCFKSSQAPQTWIWKSWSFLHSRPISRRPRSSIFSASFAPLATYQCWFYSSTIWTKVKHLLPRFLFISYYFHVWPLAQLSLTINTAFSLSGLAYSSRRRSGWRCMGRSWE